MGLNGEFSTDGGKGGGGAATPGLICGAGCGGWWWDVEEWWWGGPTGFVAHIAPPGSPEGYTMCCGEIGKATRGGFIGVLRTGSGGAPAGKEDVGGGGIPGTSAEESSGVVVVR